MAEHPSPWEQMYEQQQHYVRLLELRCELLQREVEHLRNRVTQQTLVQAASQLPALQELRHLSTPEELLHRACLYVQEWTAATTTYALRLLPDGTLETQPEELAEHARALLEEGVIDWGCQRGLPAVLPDVFSGNVVRSLFLLPLGLPGKCSAAIVALGVSPRLEESLQEKLCALGALAGILLDNLESARLAQTLQQQLRQLQKELRNSETLATLGKITGIVLHELANPLQALSSYAELIESGRGDSRHYARLLLQELTRLQQLIGELRHLMFHSAPLPPRSPIDLVEVVRRTLHLLHPQFQRDGVRIHFESELPHAFVLSAPGKLEQVFLNLFLNARDAMPHGGTLSVRIRPEGEQIAVECTDTGEGIPAELLERVFEPFFTTKAHGSGLGLSIVREIVEHHGGKLQISSTPGAGTTITVFMPAADSVAQQAAASCTALPSSSGSAPR